MFVSKKKFEELQNSVKKLTEIIENQEFKDLKRQSLELSELKQLISKIKFKVKSVEIIDDTNSFDKIVKITYQLPIVNLTIDENGVVNKDEFFYSVNSLNLIDLEDMAKIQENIDKAVTNSK